MTFIQASEVLSGPCPACQPTAKYHIRQNPSGLGGAVTRNSLFLFKMFAWQLTVIFHALLTVIRRSRL